ncbi:MAG TPA: FecR domain-containing protein [Polyangiaceae bacterium]|jgi:TolA-binding protein|nr:FecR domain-containing protein [Polyangiaceae bacterium]
MTDGQKLSAYVSRDLTERELGEQWSHIEERLAAKQPRRAARLVPGLSLAVVLTAAVVLFVQHRRAVPSAWDGALVDSGADHVSVALGDGSHIELMPASRVAVVEGSARSVRLDLRKGSAHFDVTHVPGRTFFVKSGNVTVRVVGTRFTVSTVPLPDGSRVTVAVDEGVVEAESGPGAEPTRIRAGETWSAVQTTDATPPAPSVAAPSVGVAPATPEPVPSAVAAPSPAAPPSPQQPAEHAVKAPEPTAQELFEAANAARQAGDARGAATSYEALLRRHPTDARAGLAAFELGRLKMDQLGDTRGAVSALKSAVTAAPSSAFREDALARLVRAYATLGNVESCERTRSAYLGSYPGGVHAAAVQKSCGAAP